MSNVDLERKTEKIARLMCKKYGKPEELWELVLPDAYDLYCLKKDPERSEMLKEIGYEEPSDT